MKESFKNDDSLTAMLTERAAACGSCSHTKYERVDSSGEKPIVFMKCGACNCPRELNDKIAIKRQTCPLEKWDPIFK